jgi:hypothetical protein
VTKEIRGFRFPRVHCFKFCDKDKPGRVEVGARLAASGVQDGPCMSEDSDLGLDVGVFE